MKGALWRNTKTTISFVPFPVLWGLETPMLFYWICCVCSWCMWGAGLPKWINTITSSRWLRHLVPLPVIVLMLYWLPLSREPNLHAVLLIPHTHTHTYHPPAHTSTIPTLYHPCKKKKKNSQSIFHGALEWLCHELIGHAFHPFALGRVTRHARREAGWTWTREKKNAKGLEFNMFTVNMQRDWCSCHLLCVFHLELLSHGTRDVSSRRHVWLSHVVVFIIQTRVSCILQCIRMWHDCFR